MNQHGQRVFDESVNKLFVMANESYEDFAKRPADRVRGGLRRHLRQGADHGHCQAHARRRRRAAAHRPRRRPRSSRRPWSSRRCSIPKAASSRPSTRRSRTSRSNCPSRSRSSRRPSWICWRPTRSSATSARTRTRGSTGSRRKSRSVPSSQALWDRIKPKTTYRVEFETDELVRRAVAAIKKMEKIEAAKDLA